MIAFDAIPTPQEIQALETPEPLETLETQPASLGQFGHLGHAGQQALLYARDLARLHRLQRAYERLVPMPLDPGAPHAARTAVRTGTTLVTNLHGFAALSERYADDPAGLCKVVNEHLGVVIGAVTACGGVVEKLGGGGVLATFGVRADAPSHEQHALAAALKVLRASDALNQRRARDWGFRLDLGIGLATGSVLVGLIGSPERAEHGVLGDAITVATRLAAEAAAAEVLLAASAYHGLAEAVRAEMLGRRTLRDRNRDVEVYRITLPRRGATGPARSLIPAGGGAAVADDLRLDAPTHAVWLGGRPLARRLSAQEFQVLRFLYDHRDRVCTRRELGDAIWGTGTWDPNLLHRLVHRLKAKLEPDPEHPRYVQTIPWVGYRLTV